MNPSTVLVSLFILFSSVVATAGIGGSSGGTAGIGDPKYVHAEVCDFDGRCQQVTYRFRKQNDETTSNSATIEACKNPQYDTDNMAVSCVYGVPKWLKKLNSAFDKVVQDETLETNGSHNP